MPVTLLFILKPSTADKKHANNHRCSYNRHGEIIFEISDED